MSTSNQPTSMREILNGAPTVAEPTRRRGRPRKHPEATEAAVANDPIAPKRRGRPRKTVVTEGEGVHGVVGAQVGAEVANALNECLAVAPGEAVTPVPIPDPEDCEAVVAELPDPLAALLTPELSEVVGDITQSSLTVPVEPGILTTPANTVKLEIAGKLVKIIGEENSIEDSTRYIALSNFIGALQDSTKTAATCRIFPTGLRILAEFPQGLVVGFEAPERTVTIKYRRGGDDNVVVFENCVIPSGMTFIKFKKVGEGTYTIIDFYQVATRGTVFDGEDMLYTWPGTNIWDDGRVCIGGIKRDGYKTLETYGSLQYLFYNGINNDDLSHSKYDMEALKRLHPDVESCDFYTNSDSRSAHPIILWDYFQVKEGEQPKPFPYEILKPRLKLKDFLATVLQCKLS